MGRSLGLRRCWLYLDVYCADADALLSLLSARCA